MSNNLFFANGMEKPFSTFGSSRTKESLKTTPNAISRYFAMMRTGTILFQVPPRRYPGGRLGFSLPIAPITVCHDLVAIGHLLKPDVAINLLTHSRSLSGNLQEVMLSSLQHSTKSVYENLSLLKQKKKEFFEKYNKH